MHDPQDPALSEHILTDRIQAEQKARVKATGTIWAMATAMLGICIPLVAKKIEHSPKSSIHLLLN